MLRRTVRTVDRPLSEQGPILPIGVVQPNGTISREIVIKPWRMKEERELGALLEKVQGAKFVHYVPAVLSVMCEKLGHHDFSSLKPTEKRLVMGQMFMADIFYAYIYLRTQTIGNEITAKTRCESCGNLITIEADLSTINVRNVQELKDALWKYTPIHPFEIRGKKITYLEFGPTRWLALESAGESLGKNIGEMKATVIHSSIFSIGGFDDQIVLAPHELDEMRKVDFERLSTGIDENSVGPDLSVDASCSCGKEMKISIDWAGESFFGVSSLSRQ